jgi:hypothetical protein
MQSFIKKIRQIPSFEDVIFQPECLTNKGRVVAMGWKNTSSAFLLGLEGLLQWLFRRSRLRRGDGGQARRRGTWRRTNGRRWVLDA